MKRYLLLAICAIMGLSLMTACESPQPVLTPQPTPNETPSITTDFKFDNIRVMDVGFVLNILPEDKDMEYIIFVDTKSYFTSNNITEQQRLISDDRDYFESQAMQFGMGLHDFLSKAGWLKSGDFMDLKGTSLTPDTEYVVYCYGVRFEGDSYEAITDVNYTIVRTTTPAMFDIEFDVECKTTGNVVEFSIDPGKYNGHYYAYCFTNLQSEYIEPGKAISDEQIATLRNKAYRDFQNYIDNEEMTPEEFCMKGKTTFTQRLQPMEYYMIAVFAVNEDNIPLLCSVPTLAYFETDEMYLAETNITLEVSNITNYSADLVITPEDINMPYVATLILAEDFDEMPEDEIERMQLIINLWDYSILRGVWMEQMRPLIAGKEYVIVAFGIDNKMPSTHLFYERYRAKEKADIDLEISDIVIRKVFDAEEIVALDDSYTPILEECQCMVLTEAICNLPCDKFYYWWYWEDERYAYSDEAYLEDFLLYEPTGAYQLMGLWYGNEYFFAGVVEDDQENLSDIYFGEPFTVSREDCSPAEEFFDYVARSSNIEASRTSRHTSLVIR